MKIIGSGIDCGAGVSPATLMQPRRPHHNFGLHTLLALGLLGLVGAETPTVDDDLKKMQGDWMVARMFVDGSKMPDDEAQILFRTVKGEEYTVFRYSKLVGKGSFKIDATKSPKTIDVTPAGPADRARAVKGIYEFEGEILKIRLAPPGLDRPKDFEVKEGEVGTLIVWQREKK